MLGSCMLAPRRIGYFELRSFQQQGKRTIQKDWSWGETAKDLGASPGARGHFSSSLCLWPEEQRPDAACRSRTCSQRPSSPERANRESRSPHGDGTQLSRHMPSLKVAIHFKQNHGFGCAVCPRQTFSFVLIPPPDIKVTTWGCSARPIMQLPECFSLHDFQNCKLIWVFVHFY